jgi:O-antigen/teichoic acid export membrane protein
MWDGSPLALNRRFFKNSLFGTVVAVCNTLGNFLSSLVVARILGVDGVGEYSFAIWIVAATATFVGAGLPSTLTRYLPELAATHGGEAARRLASFFLRPILLFTLAPVCVAAGYSIWRHHSGAHAAGQFSSDPVLIVLIGACCVAQTLGDLAKAYLRGIHSLDRSARITSLGTLAQLVVMVVGCFMFGIDGALIGYLVGAIIPTWPIRDFWNAPPEAEPDLRRRVLRYAKFRWATEIAASFVFARIEVFFLQMFWGVTSIGLLTASLTLANLAVQGPLMLTWGLLPHFSEQFARRDIEGLRKGYAAAIRVMGFLVLPACFGLTAIVPELIPLLYGNAFQAAVPSALILVSTACIASTSSVSASLIGAIERTDVDFYLIGIGAILSLLGGVFLIGPFGVMGAALSRAATQIIVVGMGQWYLSVKCGYKLPVSALARLAVSALLCAVAARVSLHFVHGASGVSLAIVIGGIVYLGCVRAAGGLERADIERLSALMNLLPLPAAAVAQRFARLALG